jgi:hypothetical protein
MRILVAVIMALYCGVESARASLSPPATPCPDTEREFVDLTLAHLVRQGLIDARDLFAYRAPRHPGAGEGCAAAPEPRRARASSVTDGA